MLSTLTAANILADFSRYTFTQGDDFRWSPDTYVIYYPQLTTPEDTWSLLHEIAHGELGHTTYNLDIELVSHEAEAWEYAATQLAPKYDFVIDDEYIQDHLDTYRIWLNRRSTCPNCGQNGLQTKNTYSCINCRCLWRANEARLCGLRRTRLQGQDQIS
jgi:hypothetical protein